MNNQVLFLNEEIKEIVIAQIDQINNDYENYSF